MLMLYQGQVGQLPVTPLIVNSGATFDLNDVSQQVASLSGGGAVTSSAVGNVTLILASTATGISTYSGTIGNGAGTVNLLLSGTQGSGEFLTAVNTFTGSAFRGGKRRQIQQPHPGQLRRVARRHADQRQRRCLRPIGCAHAFTIGGLGGGNTLTLSNNGTGGAKQPVALSVARTTRIRPLPVRSPMALAAGQAGRLPRSAAEH